MLGRKRQGQLADIKVFFFFFFFFTILLKIVTLAAAPIIAAKWQVTQYSLFLDCVRNVMAHAQKSDFVFRRKGRVHLNQRGASV